MRSTAPWWLAGLVVCLGGCDEGLPEIELKLSKNCNELEVVPLATTVGGGIGERVLDVAADSGTGDRAWVLVRRPDPAGGDDVLAVQQVDLAGVVREIVLAIPIESATRLSLRPDPASDHVWVVREEPGVYELIDIDPNDAVQPVHGSDNLIGFPRADDLCSPCDTSDWPRELIFLPNGPALVAMPTFSVDSVLMVWVTNLDTTGALIRTSSEHQLNFEPPCDDSTDAGAAFCEEMKMSLLYPEITLLGTQQDPRQDQTSMFGHRVRRQIYDGEALPIDSADVFMITVFVDDTGVPAGVLRSYSGFYSGEGPSGQFAPEPTADPPYGIAIDRFAAYGLFSNGGVVPRLVQLPNSDPDFNELTARTSLPLDIRLLQLDRDLALGRLDGGRWELTKLFPDDPVQSGSSTYETDAPIVEVRSGGMGTFMLEKDGRPPELVRLRCPAPEVTEVEDE